MSEQQALTSAERLAQRLLDDAGNDAGYHELRFVAMAQAHTWQAPWLAAELVAIFGHAEQAQRIRPETVAIVQGLMRAARLARSHPVEPKGFAWTNPAVLAAGITSLALVLAALINHASDTGGKRGATASVAPAIVRPNIQIVMPTAQAPQTVIVQPTHAPAQVTATVKPSAAAVAAPAPQATATPATTAPAAVGEDGVEPRQP
ncbi:MAG: hypothetical protein H7338_21495 [Candidatus Sericytochromatia bacterium]|nr:hypothetical protein [Candidatus Sericytochromatia bacterium]